MKYVLVPECSGATNALPVNAMASREEKKAPWLLLLKRTLFLRRLIGNILLTDKGKDQLSQ